MRTQADGDHPGGTTTVPASRRPIDSPLTDDPDLPFVWERGPEPPDLGNRAGIFRFPAPEDPEPESRRVLGLAAWASVLGLLAVVSAARGLWAIVGSNVPGWYQPTLVFGGLAGIVLTVGAFLSIHRPRLPWLLMTAATVPLVVTMLATLGTP